jgi:hypothetical protein
MQELWRNKDEDQVTLSHKRSSRGNTLYFLCETYGQRYNQVIEREIILPIPT